jgi:AcrR family transcriptional regulator
MAARPAVTPNRRGMKSRELVLDAAERVMAEDGFEAGTLARVVAESGIPMSSVYHYYGSKDGILLAVMERGAERFFADLPDPDERMGRAVEHLTQVVSTVVEALERHPSFLRLLIVFSLQPPQTAGDVDAVVGRVRGMALVRLRKQLSIAFGDDPRSATIDRLARFALAAFDGAFVAARTDPGATLGGVLEPLPAALVAARRRLAS